MSVTLHVLTLKYVHEDTVDLDGTVLQPFCFIAFCPLRINHLKSTKDTLAV